jgi:two-component system response regulator RegA
MENAIEMVLVVDDDAKLLESYLRAIERVGGKRAIAAASADEARALFRAHRPTVCIVDMQLPGGESGIGLIRELRAQDPRAMLVLVTGYGSMEVGAEAIRSGANHVLAKPVRLQEILQRILGLVPTQTSGPSGTPSLDQAIWEHMHRVLADCQGNKSEAARRLRVDRGTLQRWLDRTSPG